MSVATTQTACVHGTPGVSGCARIVDDEIAEGYTHGVAGLWPLSRFSTVLTCAVVCAASVGAFVAHGLSGLVTAWIVGVICVVAMLVVTRDTRRYRRVRRRVRHEIKHVYDGGGFGEADIRSPGGRRGLVGVIGELRVADVLDQLPSRFHVLHDLEVSVPRGDGHYVVVANVDHIVHTKRLCAVIETKVWAAPELVIPQDQGLDVSTITDTRLINAVEEACRGARDTAGVATCAIIVVLGAAARQIPDGGVVVSGAEIPIALARGDELKTVVFNAESMDMFCSDAPLPPWRELVRNTPLQLSA